MFLSIAQLINAEPIETTIRLDKSEIIRAIRLRLFKFDSPDGTLTLTISDGATALASQTLLLADLAAVVGDYYHGYVKFEFDSLVVKKDPENTYKEHNNFSKFTLGKQYLDILSISLYTYFLKVCTTKFLLFLSS